MIAQIHQTIRHYWAFWWHIAVNALQTAFINRGTNLLFLFGKTIRFAMMMLFLFLIRDQIGSFAGYTTDHLVVFFLTYHLLDLVAQILYRKVYSFGRDIREGTFDFFLLQPIKPLFRTLMGWPDINDVIFLIPSIGVAGYLFSQLSLDITVSSALLFGALIFNSMLIATGFHILVASLGILFVDVSGLVWMYRDLSRLAQFPVTIYLEPVRFLLFFIVPVGMMVTVPAQVLANTQPSISLAVAFLVGGGFFGGSLWVWQQALKQYSSASS